jgi:hypothetical protein
VAVRKLYEPQADRDIRAQFFVAGADFINLFGLSPTPFKKYRPVAIFQIRGKIKS